METIRQAILKIKETETYEKFVAADRLLRINKWYRLTSEQRTEVKNAHIAMKAMIKDRLMPILQARLARDEAWRKKGIYVGKPDAKARKFFETLRNEVWKILPDYGIAFDNYRNQIEKEIYNLSLRSTLIQ